MNFPFVCSNIPVAPQYGVYISQLIHYSGACCKVRKCYRRHYDLVNLYRTSVSTIDTTDRYVCHSPNPIFVSLFTTFHRFSKKKSSTTDVTSRTGTAYASREHVCPPVLSGVRVARSSVFCGVFVHRCWSICFWVLHVLSIRLRITDSDYPFGIFKPPFIIRVVESLVFCVLFCQPLFVFSHLFSVAIVVS